jgi:DNA-binding NarL/FixJ family response regulator
VITVVLIEDHGVVRAGVASLLDAAPDITVVAAAENATAGIDAVLRHGPDVVLVDLSLPDRPGPEAIREILTIRPGTVIVALTAHADSDHVTRALAAGAAGYLLKDIAPDELVKAVRSAASGHGPLDPRIVMTAIGRGDTTVPAGLTERERQVLQLLAEGLSNREIARRLGISESMAKTHLSNAYERIGVRDRTSAALWATQHLALG